MKRQVCSAIFSVCLLSVFGVAQASSVDEVEPNDSLSTAQSVAIPDGSVTISGVIGVMGQLGCDPSAPCDNDFYTFYGQEGDVVTLDIDGGVGGGAGTQDVDTVIALFSAADGTMLSMNDDAPDLDTGSASTSDARIDAFRLPATGFYVVGVSSYPRYFSNGGVVSNPTMGGNGDYKLVISGVSAPPVASNDPMQINIEVKPHDRRLTRIDPTSRRMIPVALLSSSEFNAVNVDQSSLTFGPTGDEPSLARCRSYPDDVNHDGLLDLVCDFKNQVAGFEPGDLEGVVRGKTDDGRAFEGHGLLKVVPEKHRYGHRHRHRHGHHHGDHHERGHDHDHDD